MKKEDLQAKLKQCGDDGFEALVNTINTALMNALYNRGAADILKTLIAELEKEDKPKE
jgi:hypothetical protein